MSNPKGNEKIRAVAQKHKNKKDRLKSQNYIWWNSQEFYPGHQIWHRTDLFPPGAATVLFVTVIVSERMVLKKNKTKMLSLKKRWGQLTGKKCFWNKASATTKTEITANGNITIFKGKKTKMLSLKKRWGQLICKNRFWRMCQRQTSNSDHRWGRYHHPFPGKALKNGHSKET